MGKLDKNNSSTEHVNSSEAISGKVWLSLAVASMLFWVLKYYLWSDRTDSLLEEQKIRVEDPSFIPASGIQPPENEISLTPEDFALPTFEEKEQEAKRCAEEFYQKLLDHRGKEIFLVHVKGAPMDQMFCYFSYDEMREDIEPLLLEENELKRSLAQDKDLIVEAYSFFDHLDRGPLDDQKFQKILEYYSTHPLSWLARDFWKEKLQEFHKRK